MADTKISALAAAGSVLGADELAVNEAGTSKKVTVAQIEDFIFISHSYAAGTFVVLTGNFVAMVAHLALTGSQRITLQGTARLRIN